MSWVRNQQTELQKKEEQIRNMAFTLERLIERVERLEHLMAKKADK